VTYKDKALPIVGRVCMNHTMIDLGQTKLKVGDEVTVISSDPAKPNSVVGMQAGLGLFPYTTMTGISGSVRREIV
jgi:alanine racemase